MKTVSLGIIGGGSHSGNLVFGASGRIGAKSTRSYRRRLKMLSVAVAGIATAASAAHAATYVRTTSGSLNDTNWTNASTLVAGGTPGSGDIGLFNSTIGAETNSVASSTLGSPFQLGELQITNPTGAQTISDSANTLELMGVNGVGIDMSTATQSLTLSAPVQLGSNQIWNIASSRTATVTLGVSDGGSGFGITKAGTGTLTFSDASNSTYAGTLTIAAGTADPQYLATTNQTNILSPSSSLAFGGGTLQLQMEGTQDGTPTSQTVAATTLLQGDSTIIFTRVSSGTIKIATGAITRNAGATIFFNGTSSKPGNQYAEVGNSSTGVNTPLRHHRRVGHYRPVRVCHRQWQRRQRDQCGSHS